MVQVCAVYTIIIVIKTRVLRSGPTAAAASHSHPLLYSIYDCDNNNDNILYLSCKSVCGGVDTGAGSSTGAYDTITIRQTIRFLSGAGRLITMMINNDRSRIIIVHNIPRRVGIVSALYNNNIFSYAILLSSNPVVVAVVVGGGG